jgi:hypothetical protein
MKYGLHTDQDEAILIMEDGGIAAFHNNGEHIITTLYQDRAEMFTMNYKMWSQLDDGKVHIKDWNTKQHLDEEVIDDALNWLCMRCLVFEQVDFQQLVDQYNNREI